MQERPGVEEQNVRTIQELFAAFGRGDVAAVMDSLAEDVEWWTAGPAAIPFAGSRRGPEQVGEFFAALAGSMEHEAFEPREFVAQGDTVIVVGHERVRVRATGRVVENPWVMVFTLRYGRVARYRAFEDTHAMAEAFRG